jgi:ribonuclease HI
MAVTECYIKGRYDYGVGKCAVVIVEKAEIKHQVGWAVPETLTFDGETVKSDQFNCEIIAACYALKWCRDNSRKLVNFYTNNTSIYKWLGDGAFPENRTLSKTYKEYAEGFDIAAEYVPKDTSDEWLAQFNRLVNEIAMKAK